MALAFAVQEVHHPSVHHSSACRGRKSQNLFGDWSLKLFRSVHRCSTTPKTTLV